MGEARTRLLAAAVVIVSVITVTAGPGATESAWEPGADTRSGPGPRAATPYLRNDTRGDVPPTGDDILRMRVENGRQQIRLTLWLDANPVWDTPSTQRSTSGLWGLDYPRGPNGIDRGIDFSKQDGDWIVRVFRITAGQTGPRLCTPDTLHRLPDFGFRVTIPVTCLGGAGRFAATAFTIADRDPGPGRNEVRDNVPNQGLTPLIDLP